MKKLSILLSIFLLFSMGNVDAQCVILDPTVDIRSTTTSGTNCIVEFDLSFEIDNNNGNKYIYIHVWPLADYPNPALTYVNAPLDTDLAPALVNLVIDNSGATPVLLDEYKPFPVVAVQSPTNNPGITIDITPGTPYNIYTISGIKITSPGACTNSLVLKGDSWSSQANNQNSVVHCFETGFEVGLNDPLVSGFCVSATPNASYSFNIATTSASVDAYYNVFIDNGDGIFAASSDILIKSVLAANAVTITPTSPFNSGVLLYPAAYDNLTYADRKIFVVVRVVGRSYIVLDAIDPCTPDVFDFGDLSTSGSPFWPEAKAKIVGIYNNSLLLIDNAVANSNAVWAGDAVGVQTTGYGVCPAVDCDPHDLGLVAPAGPYIGGNAYNFMVRVNSNLAGLTAYYGLWFDWNNNGDFTDDVDYNLSPAFYSGNTTTTGSVKSVPVSVMPSDQPSIVDNNYKIRLIVSASPVSSSMYNSTSLVNAEIEDYLAPQNVVLPIKFGKIKAQSKDCAVEISFEAQNEVNNKFFRIEQSTNGIDWHVIAKLESKGLGDHSYSFVHESATRGTNYYKVQQVDMDSRFTYSNVFTANSTCDADVVIGPNPVIDDLTVSVPLSWKDLRYTIFSATGQKILTRRAPSGGTIILATRNLAPGTYSVQVSTEAGKPINKVIIKR